MNIDTFVIIVAVLSLVIGAFIGIQVFRYYEKKTNKKILENAEEVLSGKRENKIKIDGEEFDATKFRVRDEDDKDIIIDLQKGGKVENGNRFKKNSSSRSEKIPEQEIKVIKEASGSSGEREPTIREKKRTSRIGPSISRVRRFG